MHTTTRGSPCLPTRKWHRDFRQRKARRASAELKFGTWNCCGMSRERHEWIQELGYDVLGVTELHQSNSTLASTLRGRRYLTAEDAPKDDKAAGVGMFLSNRMADKLIAHGCMGARVLWARLEGQFNNIFVVVAYVPHRHRTKPPFMEDTHEELRKALRLAKAHDTVIVMGDFNGRLGRQGNSRVGKYCIHPREDEGGKLLMETMDEFDLDAVSTRFRYKRSSKFGNATYIMDRSGESGQPPAQIDYILVSKKWSSSVQDCKVKWAPAIHRFGSHFDHGLIHMRFRMRIQNSLMPIGRPDFGTFKDESTREDFEATIKAAATEKTATETTIDMMYQRMTEAIQEGIDFLPKVPRKRGKVQRRSTKTMQMFQERAAEYQGIKRGSPEWLAIAKTWRNKIKNSCREDYRLHVNRIIEKMEAAAAKGDHRGVYEGVKKLTGGSSRTSREPAKDMKTGVLFSCPEERAEAWKKFAEEKFAATPAEAEREELPDIGVHLRRSEDVPTDEELEFCLAGHENSKATGEDGIPAEAYKNSPTAKKLLFELIREIWHEEDVPEKLVKGIFVPIYKNKGSSDDMSKYRFICLLNHAYKVLSALVLKRMCESVDGFLPETQAGFRANRATSDNIYILSKLIDFTIEANEAMTILFIDFVAAFDTVSHRFLDRAMAAVPHKTANERARMTKCRAIIRAIYSKATAAVRVRKADGTIILSSTFPVNRGVIQGDKVSPMNFILALQLIRKMHDIRGGVEANPEGESLRIDCLEYADDAALIDTAVERCIERINAFAEGAMRDADMEVSIPKTEAMHVKKQAAVSPATMKDVKALEKQNMLKFKCEFCEAAFTSKTGLDHHLREWCGEATREVFEEEFEVDQIVEARGLPGRRFYLTEWVGYPKEEATWEPERHFEGDRDPVQKFWKAHPELSPDEIIEVDGENRCHWCNRNFKLPSGLKGHHTKGCRSKPQTLQKRAKTAKAVERAKLKKRQAEEETVTLFENRLTNVFEFKYLGHLFQADGDPVHAVEVRAGMAKTTFHKLHEFWASTALDQAMKLRLYKCAVWSKITYGNVAWKLTDKTCQFLNGWNARCLARITGRSEEEEARQPHEGCNLVNFVRQQRFQWVGHTLRRHESFPARRMLMKQQKPYEKGSVLMDAPRHDNMDELAELAQDRESWRATKLAIGSSKQCATPPSHQRGMRTRGAARRQLEFTVD